MERERYYCIPDIHGEWGLLNEALQFIYEQNPNGGKIIFLGDYIDRGPENSKVLDTVMNPPSDWEFVCLKGNHESMFVNAYMNHDRFFDMPTAIEISGVVEPKMYHEVHSGISSEIVSWMDGLPFFHIEDSNVFAHAFYDDTLSPEKQVEHLCLWERLSDSEKFWNDRQGLYLTHGHTPRKHGPVQAQNRTNLDAGAVFYGRLVIAEYQKNVQGPTQFHEFCK
jgi:serine/threonine protein phosphatase 1